MFLSSLLSIFTLFVNVIITFSSMFVNLVIALNWFILTSIIAVVSTVVPNHLLTLVPEMGVVCLVLSFISYAVSCSKEKQKYLIFTFSNISIIFYFFVMGYLGLFLYYVPLSVTNLVCYGTLKVTTVSLLLKIVLSFLAAGSLFFLKRYYFLFQLTGYEYPLFINLSVFSMWISLAANNWMILFLSLELQALCFLVLFAWNRRSAKAIQGTLKFTVVNFIASLLILLAFVEIMLYTQSFNILNWVEGVPLFDLYTLNASTFGSSTFMAFVSFLLILGFTIKLGLFPFGYWLIDLYTSVSLPVLTFFATAPKITYVYILTSLYMNVFVYTANGIMPTLYFVFGSVSLIFSSIMLFVTRNNLLKVLAWSSISNMSLLYILLSYAPGDKVGDYYGLCFIVLYSFSTFLFFSLLQYFVFQDKDNIRHIMYFTDLNVLIGQKAYAVGFFLAGILLLNFFGIPPLVGFWTKLLVIQAFITSQATAAHWLIFVGLLFMVIIGSFAYLKIFYSLVTENTNLNLKVMYCMNTKSSFLTLFVFLCSVQVLTVFYYFDLALLWVAFY